MATLEKPVFDYDRQAYSDERLLELYRSLLLPRMIEEKMLTQLRKGKISKWFAGIGQEANAVGAASVMQEDEYILPMIRNLGVFTTRSVPLQRLFEQFQGKEGGFTQGRDRSFHFGTNEYHLVGMISHLGPQMGVADGIGLASKLSEEEKATLVFTGEGGTSEGDFHEALNVAAVWELPVIFMVENNGYGLSTPVSEQFKCERLADRGIGYGMEAHRIEGNNILEVHSTLNEIVERIRKKPEPVLIESMTFRMRGHEEASGTKYVPQELFDEWGKKDPVENFELFLKQEEVISDEKVESIREEFEKEIDGALKKAFKAPYRETDRERELGDVYAPSAPTVFSSSNGDASEKRYIDAIAEGLWQGMEQFDELVLMGQDIAEYGGAFKVTEGFFDHFGSDRVRNTPLCESAILGAALGLSVKGYKSMVEMQFADFVTSGFNQIVNNLAKSHYRWGQNADTVIRMPSGGGVGGAPFHSQSTESWFAHTPGLKVVMPAFPDDAKGLLLSALEDPNPVLY
ncbi:MAG: thiamine pyrophosphate-dependent enzyme, partial [Flavobacteriales bacterium]